MTQPLSRLAVIGALAAAGWPPAHGRLGSGYTVTEAAPGRFQVGYVSAYLDDTRATADTAEVLGYMLRELRAAGWTVAHAEGPGLEVTQAGRAAGAQALAEMDTAAYLAGRMTGLAMQLADWYSDHGATAACQRLADKLARGGIPPTAGTIGQLSGTVWAGLRPPEVPASYGQAFRDISERLGAHSDYPAPPWPPAGQSDFVLGQHHQAAALRRAGREDLTTAEEATAAGQV